MGDTRVLQGNLCCLRLGDALSGTACQQGRQRQSARRPAHRSLSHLDFLRFQKFIGDRPLLSLFLSPQGNPRARPGIGWGKRRKRRRLYMPIRGFIDQGHNPSGANAGAEGYGLREQDITYAVGMDLARL